MAREPGIACDAGSLGASKVFQMGSSCAVLRARDFAKPLTATVVFVLSSLSILSYLRTPSLQVLVEPAMAEPLHPPHDKYGQQLEALSLQDLIHGLP